MSNFAVHIFPEVRVKIIGISAETPAEALAKTEGLALREVLDNLNINIGLGNGMVAVDVEYAEARIEYALVDTLLPSGEVDYDKPQWLNGDGTPLIDGLTTTEIKARHCSQARQFFTELMSTTETLIGVAEKYGTDTLTDLLYLQAAILSGEKIQIGLYSPVLNIIKAMPSADTWMKSVECDEKFDVEQEMYTATFGHEGTTLSVDFYTSDVVTKQERNSAFVDALAQVADINIGEWTGPKPRYWAVTGRIPGDDKDTLHVFHVVTESEARQAFENAMWEGKSAVSRESMFYEHGQYVFINSIAVSDTPITKE